MKLKKTEEILEKFDGWQHLLIRHLKITEPKEISLNDSEIIDIVIKSEFHQWRGEQEPDGLTVNIYSDNKQHVLCNHKFYGFFNNNKITSKDYINIKIHDFKRLLFDKINEWNEETLTEANIAIDIINRHIDIDSTFYHLNLNEEKDNDKVALWHVYSVFIAFIVINKKKTMSH